MGHESLDTGKKHHETEGVGGKNLVSDRISLSQGRWLKLSQVHEVNPLV